MLLSWCLLWYRLSADKSIVSPITQERLTKAKRKDRSLIIFAQTALYILFLLSANWWISELSYHDQFSPLINSNCSNSWLQKYLPSRCRCRSQKFCQTIDMCVTHCVMSPVDKREAILPLSQMWRFKSGALRECFCDRLSSCRGRRSNNKMGTTDSTQANTCYWLPVTLLQCSLCTLSLYTMFPLTMCALH